MVILNIYSHQCSKVQLLRPANHPRDQQITLGTNKSPSGPTNHPWVQQITLGTNKSPMGQTNHPRVQQITLGSNKSPLGPTKNRPVLVLMVLITELYNSR